MITSGRQTARVRIWARQRHLTGTPRPYFSFKGINRGQARRGRRRFERIDPGRSGVFAGNGELLEFVEGLAAQSAAVHQEEDAACAGVRDEAIDEVAGGGGLAATNGHVDEGPRIGAARDLSRLAMTPTSDPQRPPRRAGGVRLTRVRRPGP